MTQLYSIGYAGKDLRTFLSQLQQYNIDAVADVRSVPYSKVFHDYHRESIAAALRLQGIHYVYLGDSLGPRSSDPAHYDDRGQVQFPRLQAATAFKHGIGRLLDGCAKGLRIALMCAEKDQASCHRSLLIGHYLLSEHRLDCAHIDHDGEVENESALQQRLVELNDITADMFTPPSACLQLAWRAQCKRYAYRRPSE